MAHQVKSPTSKKKRASLVKDLEDKSLTLGEAENVLLEAAEIALKMIRKGYDQIKKVHDLDKKEWVDSFNSSIFLRRWFGEVKQKSHVKDVNRRMYSVCNRLSKGITLRFRPQKERSHSAHNRGTFFEPKRFKVFPNLLDKSVEEVAAVLIHELIHVWFKDQRLGDVKVYGEEKALDLAKYKPRKARRSAENYEQFCLEIY